MEIDRQSARIECRSNAALNVVRKIGRASDFSALVVRRKNATSINHAAITINNDSGRLGPQTDSQLIVSLLGA